MFKKPNNTKMSHILWDYKKYKTPNHFEGMVLKGFIVSKIKPEIGPNAISGHLAIIQLYKNDSYSFLFENVDETELTQVEVMENCIAISTATPLPNMTEVWIGMTSGGISGVIWLDKKGIPNILTDKFNIEKTQCYLPNVKLVAKYLKTIQWVDIKKLTKCGHRERDSLLKAIRTSLFKNKISALAKNEELDLKKILASLPSKYALYQTDSDFKSYFEIVSNDNEYYLTENGDFDNRDLVDSITLLPETLNTFQVATKQNPKEPNKVLELKLGTVKFLNNKESLSILSKEVKDV